MTSGRLEELVRLLERVVSRAEEDAIKNYDSEQTPDDLKGALPALYEIAAAVERPAPVHRAEGAEVKMMTLREKLAELRRQRFSSAEMDLGAKALFEMMLGRKSGRSQPLQSRWEDVQDAVRQDYRDACVEMLGAIGEVDVAARGPSAMLARRENRRPRFSRADVDLAASALASLAREDDRRAEHLDKVAELPKRNRKR